MVPERNEQSMNREIIGSVKYLLAVLLVVGCLVAIAALVCEK